MSAQRWGLPSVIVTGTVVLAALLWATPMEAQETGEECVLYCHSIMCPPESHYAVADAVIPNSMSSAGSHSICFPGSCADKHPSCTPDNAGEGLVSLEHLLDDLEWAIEGGDVDSFRSVVAQLGSRVVLYEARDALQLRGCDGGVVGHFPLSDGLVAVLSDEPRKVLNVAGAGGLMERY